MTRLFCPCYHETAPLPGTTPIRSLSALLLRSLLLVTLCLDSSVALWSGSAMAVEAVRQAAMTPSEPASAAEAKGHATAPGKERHAARIEATRDIAAIPAIAGNTACATSDDDAHGDRSAHADCDCAVDGCGCPGLFQAAAIAHTVPFMARHALAAHPVVHAHHHVPASTPTRHFRPPIG